MKFTWGHGITIFMIGFVSFMGYLVYQTFNVHFDLVAEDYYAQELAYEDRLEEMRNTRALQDQPSVFLSEGNVNITLPEGHENTTGQVVFYDPIEKGGDQQFAWSPEHNGTLSFAGESFKEQLYEVRLQWEKEGKRFYHSVKLYIAK